MSVKSSKERVNEKEVREGTKKGGKGMKRRKERS